MIELIRFSSIVFIIALLPQIIHAESAKNCNSDQIRAIQKNTEKLFDENKKDANINALALSKEILPYICDERTLRSILKSEDFDLYDGKDKVGRFLIASKNIGYLFIGNKEFRLVFREKGNGLELGSVNIFKHTL